MSSETPARGAVGQQGAEQMKAHGAAQVVQFSDYAGRPRAGARRREISQCEMEALDEAMRTIHAAANAALKLVFMARHRLGLPQL